MCELKIVQITISSHTAVSYIRDGLNNKSSVPGILGILLLILNKSLSIRKPCCLKNIENTTLWYFFLILFMLASKLSIIVLRFVIHQNALWENLQFSIFSAHTYKLETQILQWIIVKLVSFFIKKSPIKIYLKKNNWYNVSNKKIGYKKFTNTCSLK